VVQVKARVDLEAREEKEGKEALVLEGEVMAERARLN
jgi:hypothetical protein